MTWMSHMLDWQLYGAGAMGHHLTNLLFHLANVVLLFLVLMLMIRQAGKSAFVAALFAVHPLHVESVAWVAERKDVLSALFWMLTMIAYARYAQRPLTGRRSGLGYFWVVLALAAGLTAKPMLVSLPIVLLLMDYWPLKRTQIVGKKTKTASPVPFGRLVREKTWLFALVAASSVVTFCVQRSGGAVQALEVCSLPARIGNALVSYWSYLLNTLYPRNLCAFYPYPDSLPLWKSIAAGAALAGATYLAVRLRRRRPYVMVGWLWYLITLLPVIGLVQVGNQAMADRYTYIPLIGIFIVIAWGIPELVEAASGKLRVALAPAAVAVVGACMVLAWSQIGYPRNGITLFKHAVVATSGSPIDMGLLADACMLEHHLTDAGNEFNEALKAEPRYAQAHVGLGVVLTRLGRFDEAIAQLKEAIRIKPEQVEAHQALSDALFSRGNRDEEALREADKALRLQPRYVPAHSERGAILLRLGDPNGAMAEFGRALEIDPDQVEAHYRHGHAALPAGRSRWGDRALQASSGGEARSCAGALRPGRGALPPGKV